MNRLTETADVLTQIAAHIVQGKLQTRLRTVGPATVLFLRTTREHTGKLIGREGAIFKRLNQLADLLSRDGKFEVVVEDVYLLDQITPNSRQNLPENKSGNRNSIRSVFERACNLIFGEVDFDWDPEPGIDLATVNVGTGWDTEFIEEANYLLQFIFKIVGRAQGRTFKVWLSDRVKI